MPFDKIIEKHFPELDGRDARLFPTIDQISDALKAAYDEGEDFGFRKGLEAQQGRFGKRLVPERKYTSDRQIKHAIITAILGSIKNYEQAHGKLVFHKGSNKTSLAKRIAGNVFNVFERVECSFKRDNHTNGVKP